MSDDNLLLYQDNNYTIYQCSDEMLGFYFLCLPNNLVDVYQLYIGFSNNDLMTTSKNIILRDIRNIFDVINGMNKSAIYAIPNIDIREIKEASIDNDDKLYKELYKKVRSMTRSISKSIALNNSTGIDQIIRMIKQNDDDTKFINWLEMNMPNFIQGINVRKRNTPSHSNYYDSSHKVGSVIKDIPLETADNEKVKIYVPKKKSAGFSNLTFLILILSLSLIVGISLGIFILK